MTRAITIGAPPSAVWPWLVQMGQDRAGFYSNTWLENLVGAEIHNTNSIHREWQHRAIGDSVPLARPYLFFGVAVTTGLQRGLDARQSASVERSRHPRNQATWAGFAVAGTT